MKREYNLNLLKLKKIKLNIRFKLKILIDN